MKTPIRRIVGRVSDTLALFSAIGIVGLIALIMIEIAARLSGNQAVGTTEISVMIMPAIAYFAFAYAQKNGAHVSTTLVVERLPARLSKAAVVTGNLVLLFFIGWLLYASIGPAVDAFKTGQVHFGVLSLLTWPTRAAISLGLLAMIIQVLLSIVDSPREHVSAGGGEGATGE